MRPARRPQRADHTGAWAHITGAPPHTRGRAPASRLIARSLLWLFVTGVVIVHSPGRSEGQEPAAATGTATGTVTAEDAVVVAGAEVTVVGMSLLAVTDRNGRFRIARIPHGAAVLQVRVMGYRPAVFSIEIVAGEALELELELEIDPVQLDPVAVRAADRLSPEMRGFYERRERGGGHFITREDIGRMQSRVVTDVLRRVPGVRIEPATGPMGSTPVVRMGRATGIAGARACAVLYYVNGAPFPLAPGLGIDQFIRPDEIAGMEVYTGASKLPPRFHASTQGARCGVIAIWTSSGERRQR
jgi:hypothetical protein